MEPRRTTDDDATATAPLIINGLTVRPREKVNLWYHGILFLPDFALVFVIAGLAMRRLRASAALRAVLAAPDGRWGDR